MIAESGLTFKMVLIMHWKLFLEYFIIVILTRKIIQNKTQNKAIISIVGFCKLIFFIETRVL